MPARPTRRATRPLLDRARAWLVASPGYAIAGFVHLLALFVVSLVSIAAAARPEPPRSVEVRLAPPREEVVKPPERPRALEAPALPEVVLDAEAFDEPLGAPGALSDALGSFGLGRGGRGTGGGGGGGGGARGASGASDAARDEGLDWLARHRSARGLWSDLPDDHARTGALPDHGNVSHTSLALLCFLVAGHGPGKDGPYREVVERALPWLVRKVDEDGVVGGHFQGYQQGIATLCLAEALARSPSPALKDAVSRAVLCIETTQHARGGWRYRVGEQGDTSVTSWMVLGLKAAEKAGVRPHRETWARVERYLEAVSRPDGTTAYMDGRNGTLPMTASGLFMRLVLGDAPGTPGNAAAARTLEAWAREQCDGGWWDHYGMYYAMLAMQQVGGDAWRRFNAPARDRLLAMRRQDDGCERGAWEGLEGSGRVEGLLLGTVFATLTLETYYRYRGADAAAPDPDPAPAPPPPSPGEARLAAVTAALDRASRAGAAALPALERELEAAREALLGEGTARARELAAEARVRLVQVTALQGAGDRALAHADACVAEAAPGAPAPLAVLVVRRVERLRLAVEAAQAALDAPARAELQEAARAALALAAAAAQDEAAVAPDGRAAAEAQDVVRRVRDRLAARDDPDALIAAAQARLPGPPAGPPDDQERLALSAALERATRRFAAAAQAQGPGAAALEEAERDLAWVRARAPATRLPAELAPAAARGLEQAALARLHALVALGRDADALAALAAFRAAHPGQAHAARLEALERAALGRRVQAKLATEAEEERLLDLLAAWVDEAPQDDARTPWPHVGWQLLRGGRRAPADRAFARVLKRKDGDPHDLADARLGRARVAREEGKLQAATDHLEALARLDAAGRVDARLEQALLFRAQRRHERALEEYQAVLRALGDEKPEAWWEAAIGTAETYAEAGRAAAGRAFLTQLRRSDATFGGDLARRERLLALIVRLDVMK